jgi:hypothetical protein
MAQPTGEPVEDYEYVFLSSTAFPLGPIPSPTPAHDAAD